MLIIVLATIGFLISSYFTAISYRWIDPKESWIPAFCQMGEKTCATIVFTPRARVLGLPNSVLAQLFYTVIILGTLEGFLEGNILFLSLLASLSTVVLGAYLSYSLLFITRVSCKLCFTCHTTNLAIFIALFIKTYG